MKVSLSRAMKRLLALTLTLVALLTGCSQYPTHGPKPSPTVLKSRGLDATSVPGWVSSGPQRRAAEFVATAATPDTLIDQTPGDALQRATDLMSPELAAALSNTTLGQINGWERLKQREGYVSVDFSNITGDTPQAAPNPTAPVATNESIEMEVFFTRIFHADGYEPARETQPVVWRIVLTGNQITDISTVGTTSN